DAPAHEGATCETYGWCCDAHEPNCARVSSPLTHFSVKGFIRLCLAATAASRRWRNGLLLRIISCSLSVRVDARPPIVGTRSGAVYPPASRRGGRRPPGHERT